MQHFKQNPYSKIGTGILSNSHTINNIRKTAFPHSFTTTGQVEDIFIGGSTSNWNVKGSFVMGWNFYTTRLKIGASLSFPANGNREYFLLPQDGGKIIEVGQYIQIASSILVRQDALRIMTSYEKGIIPINIYTIARAWEVRAVHD